MLTDGLNPDQIEVSIFGPGKGECVLLHLGYGDWMIVDSCVDSIRKENPAIAYLKRINVDISKCVRLIVGTHAHDDHIAGISQVFAECESAYFVCSSALTEREFFVLMEADGSLAPTSGGRAYAEYSRVFDIAERRARSTGISTIRRAIESRELLVSDASSGPKDYRVRSLSPSDHAVTRSVQAFGRHLAATGRRRRKTMIDPNELAVALWVEAADKRVLLGADLINGPERCGWSAVLKTFKPDRKASVFKVPHHGAPNAHSDDVWMNLVSSKPVALLAPFRAGRRPRPDEVDRERICSLTPHAYTAAPTVRTSSTANVREAVAALSSIAENIREPWGRTGHVRARSRIGEDGWKVNISSPACALSV